MCSFQVDQRSLTYVSFVYIMFDYDKADAAAGPLTRVLPMLRKHYFSSIFTVQSTYAITGINLVLTKATLIITDFPGSSYRCPQAHIYPHMRAMYNIYARICGL